MTALLPRLLRYRPGAVQLAGAFSFLAAIGLASAAAPAAPAAPGKTNAPPEPKLPAVSVFVWNLKATNIGRDIFYPDSARFKPAAPPAPVKPAAESGNPSSSQQAAAVAPPPPPPPPKQVAIFLNGLLGTKIAVINGISFRKGESGYVTTPEGKVRLHVDDIKAKSALITFFRDDGKGEAKEIFLRDQ